MEPGQITITREDGTSLVLHHGADRFATVYRVKEFAPYDQFVRADQGGDAPWSDGGWSGAEWQGQNSVPMRVGIYTGSEAQFMAAFWDLRAALAPVRTGGDVEVTWNCAGTEYLMYTRPGTSRLKKNGSTGIGWVTTQIECPDPAIYSAIEHTTEIGLLHRIGGFSVPFGLPVAIPSVVADGEATLVNSGTAPARLLLRITGPSPAFRVSIITGTTVQTLNIDTVLGNDDFLDIDTKDKVVLLNGSVARLPDAWGDWPLLPPGPSLIRFESDDYEPLARLSIRHRDTY